MAQTMEQRRAQHAWQCAIAAKQELERGTGKEKFNDYVNAAKGMPALIMNSGLMQVMAYNQSKQESRYALLSAHLREWLAQTLGTPKDFVELMDFLYQASPEQYRRINREAFDWLRWLRQVASAVDNDGGQKGELRRLRQVASAVDKEV